MFCDAVKQQNDGQDSGADTGFVKGGAITHYRRQCIEVCSADQSARSAEIFFASFFTSQDGLSWHLHALHYKFQMYEDCRSRGRHVLLSCSNKCHVLAIGHAYIIWWVWSTQRSLIVLVYVAS